jgi:hypothetical protein
MDSILSRIAVEMVASEISKAVICHDDYATAGLYKKNTFA